MPRTEKFLKSVNRHSQIENILLTLDFDGPDDFKYIETIRLDTDKLPLPLNNFCVQDGQFLPYIPGDTTDTILFTDADLIMQRPFSEEELERLRNLENGQIFCGWNAGPRDTLIDEAFRLGIKSSVPGLLRTFGGLGSPCFNWGCVAATRRTWEDICRKYIERWEMVDEHLNHVAKQQWLLSWLTSRFFEHVYMPPSFHAHNHYGMPEGCEYKGGLVWCEGKKALFQHRFDR